MDTLEIVGNVMRSIIEMTHFCTFYHMFLILDIASCILNP